MYNTKKTFAERIKGKRIIFVGPSPILQGKNLGTFIDSFDFVIRTNSFGYDLPEPKEDFGSRCDIAYFNNQFNKYLWPHDVKKLRRNGVKHIRFKGIRNLDLRNINRFVDSGTCAYSAMAVQNEGVIKPLMLPIIIDDVLKNEVKELHITGVDFYEGRHFGGDDYHKGYYNEIFMTKLKKDIKEKHPDTNIVYEHDYKSNMQYIKNKLETKQITMSAFTVDKLNKVMSKYEVSQ